MDITFERLVSLLLNKLKYIILVTLIVSLGTYLISDNLIEKKYTSKSALMIQIDPQSTQSTNNELNVTKQSVENYIRTLDTDNFFRVATDAINDKLGTNYTYKQIKKSSSIKAVSADKASSDFNINFTSSSPESAQQILYIITDEAMDYLNSNPNYPNPINRIEDPSSPSGPSYPKTKNYTLYAGLITFVVFVCFFFVREILDDRIKNVRDITNVYTELPILGVIPDYTPSRKMSRTKSSYVKSYSKEENKNG